MMLGIVLSMLGYANESEAPSMEFLEFLAEFGEVEDEDFDLLVYHALADSEQETATQVVEETDDE